MKLTWKRTSFQDLETIPRKPGIYVIIGVGETEYNVIHFGGPVVLYIGESVDIRKRCSEHKAKIQRCNWSKRPLSVADYTILYSEIPSNAKKLHRSEQKNYLREGEAILIYKCNPIWNALGFGSKQISEISLFRVLHMRNEDDNEIKKVNEVYDNHRASYPSREKKWRKKFHEFFS